MSIIFRKKNHKGENDIIELLNFLINKYIPITSEKNISYLNYDKLVIGTGANSFVPNIPGIESEGIFSLYNIIDAETIRKKLSSKKARDVYIIGGGLVGIETAEALIYSGARVTILEKLPLVLNNFLDGCFAKKIQNELSKKGIKIITDVNIEKIVKIDKSLSLFTNKGEYAADLIIIYAGERPNSELAKKAGLKTGDYGGIIVDKYLKTSDEDIYAIGDCTENLNLITNKLNGLLKTVTPDRIKNNNSEYKIIDVSPLTDHAFNSIPDSINIPLENIRTGEIPFDKDTKIVLYSKTSAGAYEAYRTLNFMGYTNLYVLEGGFVYWEK